MNKMDVYIKYLEMIENVIERMAKNSFQLKGWSVTLVVLVGSLSAYGSDKRFIILAFVPILVFWLLDSYYLQQERCYRAHYRIANDRKISDNDFSLSYDENQFNDKEKEEVKYHKCVFSFTECPFYVALLIALGLVVFILKIF